MRIVGVVLAVILSVLAIPAAIRAERAARAGTIRRLLWESVRVLLAVAAATALLITAIWGMP